MSARRLTLKDIFRLDYAVGIKFDTNSNPYSKKPDNARDLVVEQFKRKTSDPKLIDDVWFISGEMITNSVQHGNHLSWDKSVEVYCGWQGNKFYFAVKDHGRGFDIDNPVYHISPPDGGLGICYSRRRAELVYNFKDNVSYVCKSLAKDEPRAKSNSSLWDKLLKRVRGS